MTQDQTRVLEMNEIFITTELFVLFKVWYK